MTLENDCWIALNCISVFLSWFKIRRHQDVLGNKLLQLTRLHCWPVTPRGMPEDSSWRLLPISSGAFWIAFQGPWFCLVADQMPNWLVHKHEEPKGGGERCVTPWIICIADTLCGSECCGCLKLIIMNWSWFYCYISVKSVFTILFHLGQGMMSWGGACKTLWWLKDRVGFDHWTRILIAWGYMAELLCRIVLSIKRPKDSGAMETYCGMSPWSDGQSGDKVKMCYCSFIKGQVTYIQSDCIMFQWMT